MIRSANTEQVFSYSITARQQEVLDFIRYARQQTGVTPSVREIQAHFKFSSSNAVASHLRALLKKGYLRRTPNHARSLVLVEPQSDQTSTSQPLGVSIKEPAEQILLGESQPLPVLYSSKPRINGLVRRNVAELLDSPQLSKWNPVVLDRDTRLVQGDALAVMESLPESSIHAIVTDPPYGLIEYEADNHAKLRSGRGGVWRIPPKLDGIERSPLPRFTVLTADDRTRLTQFLRAFAERALRALVPGGHLFLASNPLLSSQIFSEVSEAGFEKRGELIRLVTTLRGGDRPKGAEADFPEISVMPRSCWEPWGVFRKPLSESTVARNLQSWSAGALRRPSCEEPFKDVIQCGPARGFEREIAPHPSLKPQRLLRSIVRAALPLGVGVVLDPFAGSGSTLAAASAIGYRSLGVERDPEYVAMAQRAFPSLKSLSVSVSA